jgi:hypothetical protein
VIREDVGVARWGRELALLAAEAHGGLDRYRQLGGVRLHMHATGPYYPTDADYLLDPARNRASMRAVGKHGPVEWRYDGKHAIILENGRCIGTSKQRARVGGLLSSLVFWFGTPFKFLDEGAHVDEVSPAPLVKGAAPSARFLVTYRGVGDTPHDWYLVSLDPQTHRVAHIVYAVTGFTTLLEFAGEWQNYELFDGLWVATRRDHHPKRALLRAIAPKVIHTTSAVVTHQALDDAMFTAACVEK